MDFMRNVLDLHLDKRFSLLRDIEDILTTPLLLVPVVLAYVVYWVTTVFLPSHPIMPNYILVKLLTPATVVFFIQRLLLPIAFIFILKRLLFEYRPCRLDHVWSGIVEHLKPALYFMVLFWVFERVLDLAGFFFRIEKSGVDAMTSLLFMLFAIFLVSVVMSEKHDLSFIVEGFRFISRSYFVLIALWFVKEIVLVFGSLSGHFIFDSVINYLIYLVIVLIFLRSSEDIVNQRGLNRTTVITVRHASNFQA